MIPPRMNPPQPKRTWCLLPTRLSHHVANQVCAQFDIYPLAWCLPNGLGEIRHSDIGPKAPQTYERCSSARPALGRVPTLGRILRKVWNIWEAVS